jgi:hypothetical protein
MWHPGPSSRGEYSHLGDNISNQGCPQHRLVNLEREILGECVISPTNVGILKVHDFKEFMLSPNSKFTSWTFLFTHLLFFLVFPKAHDPIFSWSEDKYLQGIYLFIRSLDNKPPIKPWSSKPPYVSIPLRVKEIMIPSNKFKGTSSKVSIGCDNFPWGGCT